MNAGRKSLARLACGGTTLDMAIRAALKMKARGVTVTRVTDLSG